MFIAAIIYFEHFTCTICILILFIRLYRRLLEDGDLSPKHLRDSYLWINYNLKLYVHMLLYMLRIPFR